MKLYTQSIKFTLIRLTYLFIFIWSITETTYSFLQLYDFFPSNNSLYKITGSFQNPGPYAGFLSTILPVAIYTLLNSHTRNKLFKHIISILAWISVVFTLIILPVTMSRAAWLAASLGTGIVLISYYKIIPHIKSYIHLHKKQTIIYSTIACLFLATIGLGIYYLKKDSADGRLLIWKITTRIITEHPLIGIGWGNFAGIYGQTQAEYFASSDATLQEKHVAGSPEYAFNEFLQVAVENGIIGLICFLLIVILAFRRAYRNGQTDIIGSLTAFLTFACFSYPFRVLQLDILFLLLLVMTRINLKNKKSNKLKQNKNVIFTKLNNKYLYNTNQIKQEITKNRKLKIYAIGTTLVLSLILLIWIGKHWKEKQQVITQWKEERIYYNMKIYEGTVDNYRKLYPQLRDEPKFLFELGQCLSKTGSYAESNRILLEGANQSSDPMFWNIMGKNYQAMKNYPEAEKCFKHAYHMVPNRLYPLYLLANLYFDCGETEKGIAMARKVIAKDPKVMSTAIEEMKTKLKEKIDKANTYPSSFIFNQ